MTPRTHAAPRDAEAQDSTEPAVRPTSAAAHTPAKPRAARSTILVTLEQSLTFIVLMAVFGFYAIWLGSLFLNSDQRLLDVHQNVPLFLIGLAVAVTLIVGQFDLSVSGMATLSCYIAVGLTVNAGMPMPLVIVIALAAGAVGGLVNAFLVLALRLNGFIATLGTGAVFAGISAVYSGGTQMAPQLDGPTFPGWFREFGSFQQKVPGPVAWLIVAALLAMVLTVVIERFATERRATGRLAGGGLVVVALIVLALPMRSVVSATPWTIAFLLAVSSVLWVAMRYTSFGRHLYATGGNEAAARLAGVRTSRVTTSAYVISGVLSACAGVVLASIQGSASPDIGANFLLPAFAAAFLSTVLLSLGRIHVWGTVIAGIFLIWVGQGLVIGGIHFTWIGIINGAVLVGAVSLSSLFRRSRQR